MKILVFDNYDSFTYNLVHLIQKNCKQQVDVFRNDEIALEEVDKYDKIILSPGPGIPNEAGLLLPLIKQYAPSKSILGVCLGHQAIAQSFGATLTNLTTVYHGIATNLQINSAYQTSQKSIFRNLPPNIMVGRYHSWVADTNNFPSDLNITAIDDNGFIMALQHKTLDVTGVQFHPESVLTPEGEQMIQNWLFY